MSSIINDIGKALKRLFTNEDKQYLILESSDNKTGQVIYDDKNLFFEKIVKLVEDNIPPPVNKKPVVSIEYSPTNPKKGDMVTLDSTKSTDEDGQIIKREWFATDQVTLVPTNIDKSIVSFVYPEKTISVDVTLTLTDDKQESSSKTVSIVGFVEPDQKLNPISVKASNEDLGKEAVKTLDGDFDTRWSANGDGQYIEYTFDKNYKFTRVKLTGYHYDKTYTFEIGSKRFECPAGRPENTLIEYDIKDLNIESNKLKIVGHGNNTSTYNSYREIEIYGNESDNQPPPPPPVEEPVAKLIAPSQVKSGNTVILDGSQSIADTLEITQTNGFVNVVLQDAGTFKKSFVAPDVDVILGFKAVATKGGKTDETTITITVTKSDVPPPPPPPEGEEIKLISFADNDTTGDAEDVLSAIMKEENVDGYLFVGDGPYSESGTKWVNMMKKYFNTPEKVNKFVISQGNHEDEESESEQTQKDIEAWLPHLKETPEVASNQSSWEKTSWLTGKQIGNTYIISMNSQDQDVEFKRNQFNWVMKQLNIAKGLRDSGKIDWIIAMIHKPWYTLKSSHSPYTAVRFLYGHIFKEYGVDLILEGHNHNYQMWLPMIPNESQANGEGQQLFTKLPTGEFDFSKVHGQASIVNGNAGHEHNIFKEDSKNNPNVIYANDEDYGYTVITIKSKKLVAQAKDVSGKVLATYPTILRGTNVPPPPPPDGEEIDSDAEALIIAKVGETIVLKDDGSKGPITNFEWLKETSEAQKITLIDEPSVKFGKKFVATTDMVDKDIKFRLRVFNAKGEFDDDITGTKVTITPKTDTGGDLVYDSNINGKWNNGQKRVVEEGEGDQGPDGKGFHTAASGDPTLTIDGDGNSHLESSRWGRIYIYAKNYNSKLEGMFRFETDHGEDDNISIKMRSRHGNNNHPQGGSNEFGGIGYAIHPSGEIELKAEIKHGGDSYSFGSLKGPEFKLNEWHKVSLSTFDENGGITVSVSIDDKLIGSKKWSNPHSTAIDKNAFDADSYFWIRNNCHDGKRAKIGIKDLKLYNLGN